ncbi:MAG: TlpA family protein disulfide reductase [Tannerella sp.]|jgi:thiol-disulfide isomerase/thioredoxin|nr:TlpA family protein disulfide reductase [Tannerella sp.]
MKKYIRNYLRLLAGAALFLQAGCQNKSPEAAYRACIEAENRYNAVGEKFEEAQKNNALTPEFEAALNEESDALYEDAKTAFASFFEKHINTSYAQKVFSESRWVRRLNPDQLETVVGKATDEAFRATDAFKNAADRVKYMKASAVGNPYINIVSRDTAGNVVELSHYVGKGNYVLLDFWASWCPDCRKEMPAMIELYNEFRDKNFEIVGYSLDRDGDAWKKGIADLHISWPQLSDLSYWTSPGVQFYAVQWIPTGILLSPDGIILERGLSADELTRKLREIL